MKLNKKSANMDLWTTLIREVKIRQPLWNERDNNWRNKELTCKLWNEIGTIMGVSASFARTKWNNLKDKYNCELRKQISAAQCNYKYKPKWTFFECMRFLDTNYQCYDHHHSQASSAKFMGLSCDDDRSTHCMSQTITNPAIISPHNHALQCLNSGMLDLCEICKHTLHDSQRFHGLANDVLKTVTDSKHVKPRVCKDSLRDTEDDICGSQDIKVYVQKKCLKNMHASPSKTQHSHMEQELLTMSQTKLPQLLDAHNINSVGSTENVHLNVTTQPEEKEVIDHTMKTAIVKTGKLNAPSKVMKKDSTENQRQELVSQKSVPAHAGESERMDNANCQFLMSLLPFLDQLNQVECLEVRSQIQSVINEVLRRHEQGSAHLRLSK